jgi:hypothetical protein
MGNKGYPKIMTKGMMTLKAAFHEYRIALRKAKKEQERRKASDEEKEELLQEHEDEGTEERRSDKESEDEKVSEDITQDAPEGISEDDEVEEQKGPPSKPSNVPMKVPVLVSAFGGAATRDVMKKLDDLFTISPTYMAELQTFSDEKLTSSAEAQKEAVKRITTCMIENGIGTMQVEKMFFDHEKANPSEVFEERKKEKKKTKRDKSPREEKPKKKEKSSRKRSPPPELPRGRDFSDLRSRRGQDEQDRQEETRGPNPRRPTEKQAREPIPDPPKEKQARKKRKQIVAVEEESVEYDPEKKDPR